MPIAKEKSAGIILFLSTALAPVWRQRIINDTIDNKRSYKTVDSRHNEKR
jgi:hypothetical protein